MLSVIIATLDSERALVRTLAPLVSGATSGLITEVVVADGGSSDETAAVADVAGCNFLSIEGSLGKRLKAATAAARAPWLLFLRPGTILDTPWVGDAQSFVERPATGFAAAAVFRPGARRRSGIGEVLSLITSAIGAGPRAEQGLIISQDFYAQLGGHFEQAADPENGLLRRIGRRRIEELAARAFPPAAA
jgi:glycosyltransferase involved in cell wall biosynthesis